jgi:hypothetical protein
MEVGPFCQVEVGAQKERHSQKAKQTAVLGMLTAKKWSRISNKSLILNATRRVPRLPP